MFMAPTVAAATAPPTRPIESFCLSKNVFIPDLAGWRVERMAEPPADHRFTVTPDWVCEVLSPSTSSHDRIRKMRLYARAGVPYVWIVEPVARTLEVYRRGLDEHWLVIGLHEGYGPAA